MTATRTTRLLQQIRGVLAAGSPNPEPDHRLLERFAATRDERAFEELLVRHGPLVLGVCGRLLPNPADVEDAFQATFLILARRAASIRKPESLASWLYGVAYRVALKARERLATARQHVRPAARAVDTDPLTEVTGRELLAVIDEELQQLGERYRAPLVVCYLEGKPRDEAARALGWSLSTLQRRLERARQLLRARLERRGVGLPAALLVVGVAQGAQATVSGGLVGSTVRAALETPAAVPAALAGGVLRAMAAARLRLVAAAVLLAGLLTLAAGALAQPTGAAPQSPVQIKPVAGKGGQPAPGTKKVPQEGQELTATGRVLGADGKPLAGAEVALVGLWWQGPTRQWLETETLARGKTDEQGRFRLARKGIVPGQLHQTHLLARADGHGLGWLPVALAGKKDLELTLPREQILRGRLFDLQGVPVANIKGRVVHVASSLVPRKGSGAGAELEYRRAMMAQLRVQGEGVTPPRLPGGFEFRTPEAPGGLPLWPRPFTTDAEGRFEIRGFGADRHLHLLFEDDRFARQELQVELKAKDQPPEVSLSLAPAQRIEGRLVYEDTGKPVADAEVWVSGFRGSTGKDAFTRTDAEGRFAINPYPGTRYLVRAWPPTGTPYIGVERWLTWPAGAARQTMNLALVRGVEVKGRVVEAPAGKPLEKARLTFWPQRKDNPHWREGLLLGYYWPGRTAADGSYRLVVPPGPGRFVIEADDRELVNRIVTSGELTDGKPGGQPRDVNSVLPVDLKLKESPRGLDITLRRGVTIRGRVVGPDGKPVAQALLFHGGALLRREVMAQFVLPQPSQGDLHEAIPVSDGQFELRGCDPEATLRVILLSLPGKPGPLLEESTGRLGAVVAISARQAQDKPLTVRLEPCGSAQVRFVDGKGQPAKVEPWLEMIVTPERDGMKEETALLGGPGQFGPGGPVAFPRGAERLPRVGWQTSRLRPDAEGRLTIRALIPGATYRLRAYHPTNLTAPLFSRTFTVEAGKVRQIEIVVTR